MAKKETAVATVETTVDLATIPADAQRVAIAQQDGNPEAWETLTGDIWLSFTKDVKDDECKVYSLDVVEKPEAENKDVLSECAELTDIAGNVYCSRDAVLVSTMKKLQERGEKFPVIIRITKNGLRDGKKGKYADLHIQKWSNLL